MLDTITVRLQGDNILYASLGAKFRIFVVIKIIFYDEYSGGEVHIILGYAVADILVLNCWLILDQHGE